MDSIQKPAAIDFTNLLDDITNTDPPSAPKGATQNMKKHTTLLLQFLKKIYKKKVKLKQGTFITKRYI